VSRLDRTGQTVSAGTGEIPPINPGKWFNLNVTERTALTAVSLVTV